MAVPGVTGYPNYVYGGPGEPGNAWIPVLFSGKLLWKFYDKSTVANIATTDYVGELKNVGDRIVIRTLPTITIKTYRRGQTLELEYPESPAIEFVVSKAKYFNFAIDDIDIKQSDISWIDKLADDAAQQIKIVIDSEVFSTIYPKAGQYNQGTTAGRISRSINLGTAGSPVVLGPENGSGVVSIVEKIVDCKTVLDEYNVPEEGRWMVLPPIFVNMLEKAGLRKAMFTDMSSAREMVRGGWFANIAGFDLYESNLLYSVTDGGNKCYYIPFGWKGSLVYVAQIDKTERYRPQNTFAEAMKGLIVYDFDVIKPEGFGILYARSA